MNDTLGKFLKFEKEDEIAIQYLGAAAVLRWAELSEPDRRILMGQATAMVGLPATTGLTEQTLSLIRKNADKWRGRRSRDVRKRRRPTSAPPVRITHHQNCSPDDARISAKRYAQHPRLARSG